MGNPGIMGPVRLPGGNGEFAPSRMPPAGAQSLPATPSSINVRTFTDYSNEHSRFASLHGSTGALEVNNLGGFSSPMVNGSNKFASTLESCIDGIVRTNVSGPNNGMGSMNEFGSNMNGHMGPGRGANGVDHLGLGQNLGHTLIPNKRAPNGNGMSSMIPINILPAGNENGMGNGMANQFHSNVVHPQHCPSMVVGGGEHGIGEVDDLADVFTGLAFKESSLVAAPGYGRSRLRRSSAPVGNGDGGFGAVGTAQHSYGLWGNSGGRGVGSDHGMRGTGVGNSALPGLNEVGGDFGFMAPVSCNSPEQQQQPTHYANFTSSNGVSTNNGSFNSVGSQASFNTAWTNIHPGLSMGGPIGAGRGGGGGGISSSNGPSGANVTPGIWSQNTFHQNAGLVSGASAAASSSMNNIGGGGSIPNGNSYTSGIGNGPAVLGNGGSRPNSQTSSYSTSSDSSLSGISPIYSPTNNTSGFSGFGSSGNGNLPGIQNLENTPPTSFGLFPPAGPSGMAFGEEREARSPFKVCFVL